MAATQPTYSLARSGQRFVRRSVTIGLVNNMSDEALKVTERQFRSLVFAASDDFDVEMRLFAFGQTPRSPRALEYISSRYEPIGAVVDAGLDALIVTGAQPRTAELSDESYWDELSTLIGWARTHTVSTLFSCLAAHAAVLHFDGLKRRSLAEKCTGVFEFAAQSGHPYAAWQKGVARIPHSRHNGLSRNELERAGYEVLTSSPAHGVDSFTKDFGSQFVFLQGHPEYDADSLAREYRRDLTRYVQRETERRPARPKGYFAAEADEALEALELRARDNPGSVPASDLSKIDSLAPPSAVWRDAAASFYRNWIQMIVASNSAKTAADAQLAKRVTREPLEAYGET